MSGVYRDLETYSEWNGIFIEDGTMEQQGRKAVVYCCRAFIPYASWQQPTTTTRLVGKGQAHWVLVQS
jgi:hypothetical protein